MTAPPTAAGKGEVFVFQKIIRVRLTGNTIGVGRTGFDPGPSPLRTVRADLPHTALRLAVHLRED